MNRRACILPAAMLVTACGLVVLSSGVLADMGPFFMPHYEPKFKASNILDIFLFNLLLNAILLIVPLAILTKFDYEKELTGTWVWTVPFITAVGAYADYWAFESHVIGQSTALIIIGISYFVSVVLVLGHKFITGLIVAAWAMVMNHIAWGYWPMELEYYTFRAFWTVGLVLLAIIIALFGYNTLRFLARRTDLKKKDYLRQAFCTLTTLILLFFPFVYFWH
jgi:hypothetical protein